ncbi:hypothetical protein L0P72_16370, partial [[Ruminococcus] torques]|nr:hypothetical protein [[Ruminococcus] torques]
KELHLNLDFGNELNKSNELPSTNKSEPILQFKNENGRLYLGDAILFLKTIPANSVDLIIADPPYSIKKAEW